MKALWIYMIYIWCLTGILTNSSSAQPETRAALHTFTVAEFNTLLRDLDLNADTQDDYAITKTEYSRLLTAWKSLPLSEREQLLYGPSNRIWKGTFAYILLLDLVIDMKWEAHVAKMMHYGARNLSLTISRHKNRITVKTARKTMLDLLQTGPSMFIDGRLCIPDEIKKQVKKRAGNKALKRLIAWEQLINNHQEDSDWAKLIAVNEFFNRRISVALDRGAAKGYDYWQSPIETLIRGRGDCDDFAMAKYVSLRLLGIPARQLRVAVVEHPSMGGHAVVFFYPLNEQDVWVLDNMFSDHLGPSAGRVLRLRVRINLDGYKPLWGLNENRLTEFTKGLNEKSMPADPREEFPAFAIALHNSHRLLPQNKAVNLTQVEAIP